MPRRSKAQIHAARITYTLHHIPAVLQRLVPPATAAPRPQFLLHINGRVPYGERSRSSAKACRSALRRYIRRELEPLLRPYNRQRGAREGISWDEWRIYRGPVLDCIIDQLEADGTVEYREASYLPPSTGLTS